MSATGGFSTAQTTAWLISSFVLSGTFTGLALVYARRRNLLDMPGQRRSHTQPTPRGGGIGICIAVLAGLSGLGLATGNFSAPVMVAIALVALIGWIDDHRSLSVLTRLAVQIVAASILMWNAIVTGSDAFGWMAFAALLFFCVWSINLHNFMDGIDGILAMQGIFVLGVLSFLCASDETHPRALVLQMWAVAIAGLLPFNWPRARIFMGDVGSGTVGLMIAIAAIWQFRSPQSAAPSGLIAMSAFVTDSTCTLLSRMVRGRRWYSAHREHLYQWMTRAGMSHGEVVTWFLGWNVLLALPVIVVLNRAPLAAATQWIVAACIYALAIVVWFFGKRWCLLKTRTRTISADA